LERGGLKKSELRTHDPCGTGAMLYQLSYEATHWEQGQLIEFISSHEETCTPTGVASALPAEGNDEFLGHDGSCNNLTPTDI